MFSKKTIILLFLANIVLLAVVAFVFLTRQSTPQAAAHAGSSKDAAPASAIASGNAAGAASEDALRNQREALFADAASHASQSTADANASSGQSQPATFSWPDENLVPTIYSDPDPKDPTWTPEAIDKLRLMREWFAKAAEPLKQMDPNSSEYYADWKVLQSDFDQQFRAQFGNDAFIRYERRQEEANANAAPQ